MARDVNDEHGGVFHGDSTHGRGFEALMVAFNGFELVPKGRDEAGGTMSRVRPHDEYGNPVVPGSRGGG